MSINHVKLQLVSTSEPSQFRGAPNTDTQYVIVQKKWAKHIVYRHYTRRHWTKI